MRNKKRVLISRSNPVQPDPRVEKIAGALVDGGYVVQVIGWDRTASLIALEERKGYKIHRLHINASFGTGIGNLPQLMRWQFGLLKWLVVHSSDYDVIHACDFDTIIPALICKGFWKKCVVYDIFDFYADHLRQTPGWIKWLIRRVDLWAIGKADSVILVDDSRKQQIKGSSPKYLETIYNSPEEHNLKIEHNEKSDSKFKIAYIGLLQKERGLIEMINIMARHPEWELDLAGFGGDEDEIHKVSKNFANINWFGRVDYQKALDLSNAADLLFATYDPSIPNHRYSSPNKVFEAMMLGKPIIVAKNTNMDQIIVGADCGKVIDYGNENQLETALSVLARDPGERTRLGKNAQLAYDNSYNWNIMRERLFKLYDHVLGNHTLYQPGGGS
jgi:glycosyltransferase involved in cell wall biosynthesis